MNTNSETITEQIISFKTAKLAKEKGFDNLYNKYFYTEEDGLCSIDCDGEVLNVFNDDLALKSHTYCCNGDFWYDENKEEFYDPIKFPAVTQSLLQKWLRKTNKILVEVVAVDDWDHWIYSITTEGIMCPFEQLPWSGIEYLTYEEALEIGLQEALKLIK